GVFLRLLLQYLEHVNQVPGDRVVLPVPHRPVHQFAVEPVRGSEGPEAVGQLRNPVPALLPEMCLEGVGAVALELLAVYRSTLWTAERSLA
ncbi:MAG TPA: hypothetical protein VKC15_03215, partial [Gemmatimonadales bacterium]|nr:hypothetical protein [Gemmatimonadales bacterium]